jgi:hypothetical protein
LSLRVETTISRADTRPFLGIAGLPGPPAAGESSVSRAGKMELPGLAKMDMGTARFGSPASGDGMTASHGAFGVGGGRENKEGVLTKRVKGIKANLSMSASEFDKFLGWAGAWVDLESALRKALGETEKEMERLERGGM